LRSGIQVVLFLTVVVCEASAASRTLLRGPVSPFAGNESSDLVTVHLHVSAGLNAQGSTFDNGSIVLSNHPQKGKGKELCGANATDCVWAPAAWLVEISRFFGGGKQIRRGNEVGYGTMMTFKGYDIIWRRLPGPLTVTFYFEHPAVVNSRNLGVKSAVFQSDQINATAGGTYDFDIGLVTVPGGETIQITARPGGQNLIRQLQYAPAFAAFDKATQLDPANGDAWSGLAFAASRTNQPAITIHALTMRSKSLPELPSTYFLWATAYDNLHQKQQAAEYYHHFLDASAGKFPDQEWQARQRLKLLEK
jgi:hypothetical protein